MTDGSETDRPFFIVYLYSMKNYIKSLAIILLTAVCIACERHVEPPTSIPETDKGFVEAVPDTVVFANADFIYYGNESVDLDSDWWVIKLYTDMEIDLTGAPIGPGAVTQLCLNVKYNESQTPDPSYLKGVYREMMNSGNFAPGTFASGYMVKLELPGQTLELADGTFYASLAEGSTDMDYDLIDEGALSIQPNDDGTYTIEGVLVGKRYTKRYFTWTGLVEPRNNVPEETPNSTLKYDLAGISFAQCQLQDKGDSFYLMDESYRCLLLYLAEESVDMSSYRPAGNGGVLRLEFLVPWEVDYKSGIIPEGTYSMITRNEDTSIDKDKIVPGAAIPGLPNVFAAWKVSGSWYYDLNEGVWGETYARIDKGTITISKDTEGNPIVIYDLEDCQGVPRKITGQTSLKGLQII